MSRNEHALEDFLTSPELRSIRASRVAAVDGNPHEVCVYYIAHLHNLAKIATSGGILPKASVEAAHGDLAGQQVQWRRDSVTLTLGPAVPGRRRPIGRPLHACVNFFWNPDNLTKWAFQVRALHQAAEQGDPAFGCLCIVEVPISGIISNQEFYWCASDRNLASSYPRQTYRMEDLIGMGSAWPWRQIFAVRDRLHNAAEFVAFRANDNTPNVSAPVPAALVRRVLVSRHHLDIAAAALKGTIFEAALHELHNSSIFPAPFRCLHQETQFSQELAALSQFGITSAWLRETFADFRQCRTIAGRDLEPSCFSDEALAFSQHGIGHVTRVMFWAVFLARWCGVDAKTRRNVLIAAFLHDLAREGHLPDTNHGDASAGSDFTANLFASIDLPPEDQNIVRNAVRLHCIEPHDPAGHGIIAADLLRNADALERGRFGKPRGPGGCDPDRLNLKIFEEYPGAAEVLASIAQRIALFTRYENWSGDTCVQLIQRISSALCTCVHHGLLEGSVLDTAVSLLDPSAMAPESLALVQIQLSGGMIPKYAFSGEFSGNDAQEDDHGHRQITACIFTTTVSCSWGEAPMACVLENIITRGAPCPASRYITEAAQTMRSVSTNHPVSGNDLDILFTTQVQQVQRALTHLMAGRALSEDSLLWRIAIKGLPAQTAYMAVVDFHRLLKAIRVLQRPKSTIPRIELLLPPDDATRDWQDEPEIAVHLSPHGRYEATVDFRMHDAADVNPWLKPPRSIHSLVVSTTPDNASAVKSLLRNSDPIEYSVDVSNPAHIRALEHLLRNIFWKEEFRSGQVEVISRALQRKDAIALLPTGAGKSLTYQIAALLQPGITIVVDPLKSLMRDQDKSLKAYGIDRSVFINSSLNSEKIAAAMDQIAQGRHQFVFISPERLQIKKFRHMLRGMEGQTFAYCIVDEAHCVSEWGHDFRTSYLRLGDTVRRYCPTSDGRLPLIALTGTASYDVLSDVQKELDITDSEALIRPSTYERKELHFGITRSQPPPPGPAMTLWKRCALSKQAALHKVLQKIPAHVDVKGATSFERLMSPGAYEPSAGLIFCPHKTGPFGARPLAEYLKRSFPMLAHAIGIYHGASSDGDGLDDFVLEQTQVDFMSGRKSLLACTKAFGMGIDKPNIRFTIHFAMPQSIEAFYQEAGRAGRDRKTAYCGLIYTDADSGHSGPMDQSLLMSFHNNSFPGRLRDASGLAELLLGSKAFAVYGDKWHGLEQELRTMRPRESRMIRISFENFGITAIAKAVHVNTGQHVYAKQVRKALFFCENAEKFVRNLSREIFSNAAGFSPAFGNELESLFNSTRLEPETFRAVYRLLVLGLLDDYEIDYGRKKIHANLVRLSDDAIKANLINYLTRYLGRYDKRVQNDAIDTRRGATLLQKCCGHLLDFVYAEIAAKRHRAIQNMESAVRGGLEYGIEEFTRRVNTYFDSRFTSNILDDLREKPVEWIIETYIKESKGRPDDVEHLWGSCDRLLETNPTHAGLFLIRAYSRWATNRGLDDAVRDARKGYEILSNDYGWQPTQLAAFQSRFISWIESVNPDAANHARTEIIAQHIDSLSDFITQSL